MNKAIKRITGTVPFVVIILVNSVAAAMLKSGHDARELGTFLIVVCVVVLANLILAAATRTLSYFAVAISATTLLGCLSVFVYPQLGELFLYRATAALYIALFSSAFFPPLFGIDPFTYEFSKKDYPDAVHATPQFKSINLILNYLWAFLFAMAFVLTLVRYTDDYALQQILQSAIPVALQLLVGLPLTRRLPALLRSRGGAPGSTFGSVREMFEAMPFGLNTKKSQGIDFVLQFRLEGEEEIEGYLTVLNNECTFSEGVHPEPTSTVIADSGLWLDISNGDVSGEEAYINRRYTIEGDAGVLLNLNDLFTRSEPRKKPRKPKKEVAGAKYVYSTFEPNRIRRIVVINASPRSARLSKSLMMANRFVAGAESAGAEAEMVTLKDKTINPCTCCYTCWTKTPGVCIYQDDMPELIEKVRKADLVVYVTPLFIFSVSAQLKVFMDRMLPNMKPYMVVTDGLTHHPHRYEEDRPHGLVVFAAGGFPEVSGNFDGISATVRNMGSHLATTKLMAEFYLPASELLQQPVYRERKERVEEACYNAGRDAVLKGTIGEEYMQITADIGIEQDVFVSQANMFWKSLDGKKSFAQGVPALVD